MSRYVPDLPLTAADLPAVKPTVKIERIAVSYDNTHRGSIIVGTDNRGRVYRYCDYPAGWIALSMDLVL